MLKINKKNICNTIFFLFIVGITFYLLLKDQEIPLIVTSIRRANIIYLLLGLAAVIFFVCFKILEVSAFIPKIT